MIHGRNTGAMTKHVGIYKDKKVVIVLQLPEATNQVHIIDTESLPDLYHQNLMEIVTSPEGQAAKWLGDVLSRKMLYDGTNALRTFYEKQIINSVSAYDVQLAPLPNHLVPFVSVYPVTTNPLAEQQDPAGVQNNMYAHIATEEQAKLDAQMNQVGRDPADGYNQHAQNLSSDVVLRNQQISNNLLAEAQMLEAEAAAKRAQAAQYVKQTAPTPIGVTGASADAHIDTVTGRTYKTAGALKGAITKREKAASNG